MGFGRELHRSCDLVNVSSMNSGLRRLNVEEVIPLNIVYITALTDCPVMYRSFRASSTTCFSTIQVDEIRRTYINYYISHARFLHLVHYMHINNSKTIQNEYENKSVSIDEFAAIKLDMP
jgi:hypothetical protein